MLRQSTFPRGGMLNRLRTRLSFRGISREIPYNRDGNSRIRYAAGRGRPALPTATPRIGHNVISSVSQEVSLREKRNFTHSRRPTCLRWLTADKTSAVETKVIIHPLPQTLARRGSLPRQPTCSQGLPAAKKEADETSASVNRCPVCPNPTRRVENQAYVYEFCRDFADIVLLVESYLITPSLMVREKRSLRPRRISSGITRALFPSAST